jgi:hypothetical protein
MGKKSSEERVAIKKYLPYVPLNLRGITPANGVLLPYTMLNNDVCMVKAQPRRTARQMHNSF